MRFSAASGAPRLHFPRAELLVFFVCYQGLAQSTSAVIFSADEHASGAVRALALAHEHEIAHREEMNEAAITGALALPVLRKNFTLPS